MAQTNKSDNNKLPVKLAKPARRALSAAGITTLQQLSKLSEEDLLQLHGIGQNAIQQIKKALSDNGLSFAEKKK
jgi:DNA-directed RNA polymerase alpha subunit